MGYLHLATRTTKPQKMPHLTFGANVTLYTRPRRFSQPRNTSQALHIFVFHLLICFALTSIAYIMRVTLEVRTPKSMCYFNESSPYCRPLLIIHCLLH